MKKSTGNTKGKTKTHKVEQGSGTSGRLSLAERNSVIADRLNGMTNAEIAAKYHKHPITISRVFSKFRKIGIESGSLSRPGRLETRPEAPKCEYAENRARSHR